MNISPEKLAAEADLSGFRPEILEKVANLLNLLEAFRSHPFLKGRLALKGGTALNLFIFDLPRLSVDIDLNYVGAEDREIMLEKRDKLEKAMGMVFSREGFTVRRIPTEHAGGKWSLRYRSALGQGGNLDVDINFMCRVPLWPIVTRDSHQMGAWQATDIPVVDIHELAAGKLCAMFSRRQARDLFDSHRILRMDEIDPVQLRLAFVVFGAMSRKDWRSFSVDDVELDAGELARQLVPTLRVGELAEEGKIDEFGQRLVNECRQALSSVLPFTEAEKEFLDLLLDEGEIDPSLLTDDVALRDRIRRHPLLEWKALNVRKQNQSSP